MAAPFTLRLAALFAWALLAGIQFLVAASPEGKTDRHGTLYLNDPSLLGPPPLLLPTPTPTPSPTPRPRPSPTPQREVLRPPPAANPIPSTARTELRPQGVSGTLSVGREIPVPVQYSPAQIQVGGGQVVVVPSTPTRFRTVNTGVSFGESGFRQVELEGFVNYGSPIRTLTPVFGPDGRLLGQQLTTHPNPILQPVIRRTEFRQP